jgi:hypothetical protein
LIGVRRRFTNNNGAELSGGDAQPRHYKDGPDTDDGTRTHTPACTIGTPYLGGCPVNGLIHVLGIGVLRRRTEHQKPHRHTGSHHARRYNTRARADAVTLPPQVPHGYREGCTRGMPRTSENPGVPRAIASALKATSWPYVRSAAAMATPSPLYLLSQDRKMRHVFPTAPGVPGAPGPTPAPAATAVEVSTAVG